jgi:ribosomal protein S18 acetylase RimI-like enzyme
MNGFRIYIEDRAVTSSHRGKGYGKALLWAMAREVGNANEYKMGRLQLSVLKWNKPAIDLFFSDAVGAFKKDEYLGCQVEGEKLVRPAGRW